MSLFFLSPSVSLNLSLYREPRRHFCRVTGFFFRSVWFCRASFFAITGRAASSAMRPLVDFAALAPIDRFAGANTVSKNVLLQVDASLMSLYFTDELGVSR